jgi:hypothetical protein
VVVIDESVYGRMNSSKVGRILDELRREVREPSVDESIDERVRGQNGLCIHEGQGG